MEDYELDAWLGDTTVTDEQRFALHHAWDLCAARYGEDLDGERGQAFSAAAQIILGDDTLEQVSTAYARARRAERDAMAALAGAVIAASATQSEAAIVRATGLTRVTVRRMLQK